MRSEDEIRGRLALELMSATSFESSEGHAARACEARAQVLLWVLSDPTETDTEPPSRGNGMGEE